VITRSTPNIAVRIVEWRIDQRMSLHRTRRPTTKSRDRTVKKDDSTGRDSASRHPRRRADRINNAWLGQVILPRTSEPPARWVGKKARHSGTVLSTLVLTLWFWESNTIEYNLLDMSQLLWLQGNGRRSVGHNDGRSPPFLGQRSRKVGQRLGDTL